MRDDTTRQSVVFKDLFDKPVVARFDQPDSSSDGGALLLKACDERLGLTDALVGCLDDGRQQSKVEHSLHELVRQRVFGIACGYEDCNDAARLSQDPMHKLLVGRDPMEGAALASQSTLSRFENALGPKALMRMGLALADTVIARHRKRLRGRVKHITVELDPTDDPTHGAQQLSFFNGHYDTWCYLPTAGFVQFDDEPEQYLFAYVLRPGNANAKLGAIGILRRILERLGRGFPKAKVLVRLAGRGGRIPADRRHRCTGCARPGRRLPLRRTAVRLRLEAGLPTGHRRARGEAPRGGRSLLDVPRTTRRLR